MRGGLGLLVVVAAFAAGVGLGFILKSDAAPSGRTMRTIVERRGTAAPRLDPARADSLRELLEAIPIDSVPSGSGKVTGVVRTRDGKPLAGVEIVARPQRDRKSPKRSRARGRPPKPDLVKFVEESIQRTRWSQQGSRESVSTEDGTFAVEGLGEGVYYFQAYAAGYAVRGKGKTQVRAGSTIEFEARSVARVAVDIAVNGSGPPEKATIKLTTRTGSGNSSSSQRWNSDEPWIELSPGSYELRAYLTGELGGRSDPQHVTVKEGDAGSSLRFTIEVKPALRVTAQRPTLFSEARLHGWLSRAPEQGDVTPEDLVANGVHQFHNQSGGRIVWKDLQPGRYVVGVSLGRGYPLTTATVEIAAGIVDQALVIPEPSGEGIVRVRLLGPEGEPVQQAQWTIAHKSKNSSTSSGVNGLRRSDGVFFLLDRHGAEREGGEHSLSARSDAWGVLTMKLESDSDGVVEMQFATPATPKGLITGYKGSGYEGRLQFKLEPAGKANSHIYFREKADISADGQFALKPQQPGDCSLVLFVSTGQNGWAKIAEQRVSLRSGDQTVSIAMPTLHKLRVVWGGKGKPRIGLNRERASSREAYVHEWRQRKVGADGTAKFDGLTPGRYKVSVNGMSSGESPIVEVPGPAEIRVP